MYAVCFQKFAALTICTWPSEYHGGENKEDVVIMIIFVYVNCQALLIGQHLSRAPDVHPLFLICEYSRRF